MKKILISNGELVSDYYNEIKKELVNNEINRKVKKHSINKADLNTYYNVGKILHDAGKHYGEGIVKEYSIKLSEELGRKYSYRTLNYMVKFYNFQKMQSVTANLSWGHWIELLSTKDTNKINYYINQCNIEALTTRQLRSRIKNKEYERLPEETKNKLITTCKSDIKDLIKNPIIIKNNSNYEIVSEKILQKLILEDIPSFLKELGNGFTFIENEYKIKLGDRYNYIDLLLYNIKYNCYVVVELKVIELKKKHIGQIKMYMNYVDRNLKRLDQDNTIGIIICRKDNHFVMEYCSDDRILSREYNFI